jgi:ketosteroid isomerase-like protein
MRDPGFPEEITMTERSERIDPAELPAVITSYLKAHMARDVDVAVKSYAIDGVVTDEGKTYRGAKEIRQWLSRSASEFTYTIEITGATKVNANSFIVMHHLEGNFPGGRVDLQFRFNLRDGAISHLTIEE